MKPLVIIDQHIPELEEMDGLDVVMVNDYLRGNYSLSQKRYSRTFEIINLCRQSDYLSRGYYASLLGQARGEVIIPSVEILLVLNWKRRLKPIIKEMNALIAQKGIHLSDVEIEASGIFHIFLGSASDSHFKRAASVIYDYFPAPILEVTYHKGKFLIIDSVELLSTSDLWKSGHQTGFLEAIKRFSKSMFLRRVKDRKHRQRLAILVNPKEKLPPSNPKALESFIRIGADMGLDVELIEKQDSASISEYDALFIRETTSIDHHTFAFAQDAVQLGIPVIDDPESIVKCSNKVYLTELFRTHNIAMPETYIIDRRTVRHLPNKLAFPMVIKIPDGSFGIGVHKVRNVTELKTLTDKLFYDSDLLLAQEYVMTEYDWRVGILNNSPLFICKYFMAKDHWQIVKKQDESGNRFVAGKVQCFPVDEAPADILELALRAARHIGNGLYGVDIKEREGGPVIMEINDNPNVDHGYEDSILKDDLYRIILGEFIRRMDL